MVTARYFIVKENAVGNGQFILTPADDFLPLVGFQTFFICGNFEHEGIKYAIIKAAVPMDFIQEMATFLSPENFDPETGSPLTMAALDELGITHLYGGQTEAELFQIVMARFGLDISGEREVGLDENGELLYAPWVVPCKIAGE